MMDKETFQPAASRKPGRPKGSKNKPPARQPERTPAPDTAADKQAAFDALNSIAAVMLRLSQYAHIVQADEVRELGRDVLSYVDLLDELLADLRRELHIALRTAVDHDTSLPRDIVDVLDYLNSLGKGLRQTAGSIEDVVKEKDQRPRRGGAG